MFQQFQEDDLLAWEQAYFTEPAGSEFTGPLNGDPDCAHKGELHELFLLDRHRKVPGVGSKLAV